MGDDVAVAAQIPDANEALQGLHGRLLPFGLARLLWRIHVRGTRMTRVPMVGVAKKWRNTKVGVSRDRQSRGPFDRGRAPGRGRRDRV